MSEYSHVKITVESLPGSDAYLEAIAKREYSIGGNHLYNQLAFGYLGEGKFANKPWAPAKNVRVLFQNESLTNTFMTKPGTGITSIEDLKGKSLPKYAWTTWGPMYDTLLEVYGFDLEKDIKWIPVENTANAWGELAMNRLDAVTYTVSTSVLKEQEVGQIVYIPIPPEKLEEARAANPGWFRGVSSETIMPGSITGLKINEPLQVIAISALIFGNTDLPDDVAYTILKTLFEHTEEVQAIHGVLRDFSPEWVLLPADVGTVVPYHPGAVKAYKEFGVWTAEHEKMQQKMLK